MGLSHPESFPVGDSQDLPAVRAEIDISLSQKSPNFLKMDCS